MKRLLDDDENILWSQKPKVRIHVDRGVMLFLLLVMIPLLTICFVLDFTVKSSNVWVPDQNMFLDMGVVLLSIFASFAVVLLIITYRQLINTEYYITNKRIISIRFKEIKRLLNLYITEIEFFFFIQVGKKQKSLYNFLFSINHSNEENFQYSILSCRPLKDIWIGEKYKVEISKRSPSMVKYLSIFGHIQNKEEIIEILQNKLGIEMKDPPRKWRIMFFKRSEE